MDLFVSILAGLSIIFGIGVLFARGTINIIAGLICIGGGIVAYDQKTFFPLLVSFGLLWLLRLFGLEKK